MRGRRSGDRSARRRRSTSLTGVFGGFAIAMVLGVGLLLVLSAVLSGR